MSVLLSLIRQLFEYFGIPTNRLNTVWESYTNGRSIVRLVGNHLPSNPFSRMDLQLIPVWEFKEYGRTRSVVRMIGTVLPFSPCPRPRFQSVSGQSAEDIETLKNSMVPSLADVAWLMNYGRESCTKFRNDIPTSIAVKPVQCSRPTEMSTISSSPDGTVQAGEHFPQNNETIQKIAALEEELARLRAQIAAIVAVQEQRDSVAAVSVLDSPSDVHTFQGRTSTPLSTSLHQPKMHPAPPPPPPPPLPPPPLPASTDVSNSVISLIKKRRAANNNHPTTNDPWKDSVESMPSMMDVLKDLNKIRLRAVERSPGGTPIMKKEKKQNSLSDPAALIASALKQKFAHHKNDDSFGKENQSYEGSPFSSPETPVFGRHLLKPIGKRPSLIGANQAANAVRVKVPAHV
ncbi:mitochondrial fission regulator 2 isoform X1 [Pleurodeles waltl]|uniref:mitochondrial fission regulator 2 isoform X1 n=1 Tax=Pleurodeles waltl TaxID=8319 RepID=UPI003709A452